MHGKNYPYGPYEIQQRASFGRAAPLVMAASNHTAKAYHRVMRGKGLYRAAAHRTHVYHSRFADYIMRSVFGSHKAWRTYKLINPHVRAPHYHTAMAQTDCFEMVFDDACSRWNGTPAIHVAV